MTGEVPAPEGSRRPIDIAAFRIALVGVISAMHQNSHSTFKNAHEFVADTLKEQLLLEAERTNGALYEGYFWGSSYFYTEQVKRKGYQPEDIIREARLLPGGERRPFYAVQRGVEEIVYEEEGMANARHLCAVFDPLYSLFDNDVNTYLANRGRSAFLRHPFGKFEHANERLWAPLFYIDRGYIDPLHMPVARVVE